MNTKILLGISFAVVAGILLSSSAFAGAGPAPIDELVSGKLKGKTVKFNIDEDTPIPRHGEIFGGYGVLSKPTSTDPLKVTLLVVTSHQGFYDSEFQIPPTTDTFASPFVEICDASPLPTCGPQWHAHLVNLMETDETSECMTNDGVGFPGLMITGLTYENPVEVVDVTANMITLKSIAKGTNAYTESITGDIMDFKMQKSAGLLLAFDIVPRSGDFCVENVSAVSANGNDDNDD